jgi:hypothetical protein
VYNIFEDKERGTKQMKKFKIGKYYYTKNEIAILTILKWFIELCKLAIGVVIMLAIMILPFYLVALMEKYVILAILMFILDIYLICKMLCED